MCDGDDIKYPRTITIPKPFEALEVGVGECKLPTYSGVSFRFDFVGDVQSQFLGVILYGRSTKAVNQAKHDRLFSYSSTVAWDAEATTMTTRDQGAFVR